MFGWGQFWAVWKGRGGGQELSAEVMRVPSTHLFDQCFCFKHISLFLCSDRRIFQLVPSFSLLHQRFHVQKWGNFESLHLSNEWRFWKKKKLLLVQSLRNVSQKFQISAKSRKYRSGQADNLWFWYPKLAHFRVFFAVFSGTAHELMVPVKPHNAEGTNRFALGLGAERFQAFKMSPCIIK